MKIALNYKIITPDDFSQIITLGTQVHGEGYLDSENIKLWYKKGVSQGINAGYVVYHHEKLVGFRITYAASQWDIDQWCTPHLWHVESDKVCYFKCNTVDEHYRGHGIGGELLRLSITAAKKQGALAGISHLWKQSPNNSAVKYFSKCGGKLIKEHPDKWHEDSINGYNCTLCGFDCHCEAAEMIIHFS
jgi:GNAT superfamily N-acetyltransferase